MVERRLPFLLGFRVSSGANFFLTSGGFSLPGVFTTYSVGANGYITLFSGAKNAVTFRGCSSYDSHGIEKLLGCSRHQRTGLWCAPIELVGKRLNHGDLGLVTNPVTPRNRKWDRGIQKPRHPVIYATS